MDERQFFRRMRRTFSTQGWTLLVYFGIMNLTVMGIMIYDGIRAGFLGVQQDNSGWGYFLAIAIGLVILLLWKKPRSMKRYFHRGRPMAFGSLLALLVLCLGAQIISQIVIVALEMLLNSMGKSLITYLESLQMGDTLPMFLYGAIGAPISEELLFRGLILRSVEPYGKKVAIFVSALLFGLFHGNLIQIPFAFAVGLILGYVALEYNLLWAMALHMFNNLIYADTFSRLIGEFQPKWETALSLATIFLTALGSAILLIVKREAIREYLHREQMDKRALKACFSSAGTIVLTVVMILSALSMFLMI